MIRCLIITVAGQAATVTMVGLFCLVNGRNLANVYTAWDAHHYLAIAANGYDFNPRTDAARSSPAFFPGYPMVVRALSAGGRISQILTAGLLSVIATFAFALGLATIADELGLGREAALRWVALVTIAPMSAVLVLPYSESFFCALASWTLVMVLRRRLIAAGLLAMAAGTVRPTGVALTAALAAAVFAELRAHQVRRRLSRAVIDLIAPPLLSAVGPLAFWSWVGWRTRDPLGWFHLQDRIWHTKVDFGAATVQWISIALTRTPAVLDVVTAATLLAAIPLSSWVVRELPLPLRVYTISTLLLVVGTDGVMNSKVRLLLPAFTLLLPLTSSRLWRHRRLVAFGAALSVAYTAYALVIYPYAI